MTRISIRAAAILALGASALGLAACGHTIEQKAATGAIAGAVVAARFKVYRLRAPATVMTA